jgi:hypothetical protein
MRAAPCQTACKIARGFALQQGHAMRKAKTADRRGRPSRSWSTEPGQCHTARTIGPVPSGLAHSRAATAAKASLYWWGTGVLSGALPLPPTRQHPQRRAPRVEGLLREDVDHRAAAAGTHRRCRRGWAQSRCRCGGGEPQSRCRCGRGGPSPGCRCRRGRAQSRCRCGTGRAHSKSRWCRG